MATRLQLQDELESILGSRNVYYQPPATLHMKYPCIVYGLDGYDTIYADNNPYAFASRRKYQLTYIDRDPDAPVIEELLKLRTCRFDRMFINDGLYHYIFRIYY